MRVFHIQGDQFTELQALPEAVPAVGYLWVGTARQEFDTRVGELQAALQRFTGGQLVDLHVSDLLNPQLPSHFDYTSLYDLLVFRRLSAHGEAGAETGGEAPHPLARIDTSPVGLAVFDRVLLSVHPADCLVREYFANRLAQQAPGADLSKAGRMPPSPADMALRMANFMVDSYLDLRKLLTRQLDQLQQELFAPSPKRGSWKLLLDSRNGLHLLEDTCEDQRAAITEWIDAIDELPHHDDPAVLRERELLRVRARDVLEHIERVLSHVRRLEASAENAVQMHFSAQSNSTNEIMRTLTVLTAIFLPLNLVTGFFGMNFDTLPGIHSPKAFWITAAVMLAIGVGLSVFFWRKRYLGRTPK
jgi:magnesium transporter